MIPDHTADTRVPTVADEIALANVVRLEKHDRLWSAVIGPDALSGLRAWGHTPREAVVLLMIRCQTLAWCFDESWREPLVGKEF